MEASIRLSMDGEPGDAPEDAGLMKTLVFSLKDTDSADFTNIDNVEHTIDCMVCPDQFNDAKEFFQHLVLEHKIIIADSKMIAYLKGYADYWKRKFCEVPFQDICSKVVVNEKNPNSEVNGDAEYFYLLSNAIDEDKILREKLKRKRLEVVLSQLEKERTDVNFNRSCLFCKKNFAGNRGALFSHISHDHNLSVGCPDNIVFAEQFLDLLEKKINVHMQCLFCEKTFRDVAILKEHMRKKLHKKINPKNTEFDKFYLINYLELGKNWEVVQAEDDAEIEDGDEDVEESWGDWHDTEMESVCLFCDCRFSDGEMILHHLKDTHGFDLCAIKKMRQLSFYKQVKLINYIRRQMFKLCCFSCLRRFECHDDLVKHLNVEKHTAFIPDASLWDEPQYLFPTYENDNLLCALEDNYDETDRNTAAALGNNFIGAQCGDNLITLEEIVIPTDSVLWNETLRQQLF